MIRDLNAQCRASTGRGLLGFALLVALGFAGVVLLITGLSGLLTGPRFSDQVFGGIRIFASLVVANAVHKLDDLLDAIRGEA